VFVFLALPCAVLLTGQNAHAAEAKRDRAEAAYHAYELSSGLLQIAIVLASVAIITGGSILLVLSAVLAADGLISMLNGFMLLYSLPFIG
jgi:hypothetical protein